MTSADRLGYRLLAAVTILAVAAYFLLFRHRFYRSDQATRAAIGMDWKASGFSVALVWPHEEKPGFVAGAHLAVDELNAEGGPLASKIRLIDVDENASGRPVISEVRHLRDLSPDAIAIADRVAHSVVSHEDVMAVIGYQSSEAAIAASVIYENHGVLLLASAATSARLTEHNFNFVFRLTPDDREIGEAIADFAKEQQYKRVGVVYARTEDSTETSNHVISGLRAAGIDVPVVRSYSTWAARDRPDYRPMAAGFLGQSLDAIVLADTLPRAADVIDDFAALGYKGPILGTDKLESTALGSEVGPAAGNVYVASTMNPAIDGESEVDRFRKHFHERWGIEPGYLAMRGYESMELFIHAVVASESADPTVLATTLRTRKWNGLSGSYTFDPAGNVVGREISIKRLRRGQFEVLARLMEKED
jgi:ABC-type branched-subunit amino acid transport system substrate-binding protein